MLPSALHARHGVHALGGAFGQPLLPRGAQHTFLVGRQTKRDWNSICFSERIDGRYRQLQPALALAAAQVLARRPLGSGERADVRRVQVRQEIWVKVVFSRPIVEYSLLIMREYVGPLSILKKGALTLEKLASKSTLIESFAISSFSAGEAGFHILIVRIEVPDVVPVMSLQTVICP